MENIAIGSRASTEAAKSRRALGEEVRVRMVARLRANWFTLDGQFSVCDVSQLGGDAMKASSGIELMMRIERDSAVPLRVQLESQLRDGVRSGALKQDVALPSSRALAQELGIARGVVTEAYAQLAAEGYLVSRQGAPTRVGSRVAAVEAQTPAIPVDRAPRFDFRPGAPDIALFPRAAWAGALRQALRDAPDARFGYADGRGVPELRAALATYLGRVRGVAVDSESLVLTVGVTQGLVVTARALAAHGIARIAVEDPGSADMRRPLDAVASIETLPVAVDEDGLDVDALDRSGARAVLVTPAHHYPTGVVLAPHRRAALLRWANDRDAYVLEDDYDAEYRYDRPPVGALQGLDPQRVVYLSSISKTLAPALRIGWLAAPPALAEAIRREKNDEDGGSPVLEQLGFAILLERGEHDRHVRRSRLVYRGRRDLLIAALAEHLPDLTPTGAAAGLHLVVELPPGTDEAAVVHAAAQRDVALEPLARHTVAPRGPGLIVGYGRIADAAIERGVRELAAAIRQWREPPRPRA